MTRQIHVRLQELVHQTDIFQTTCSEEDGDEFISSWAEVSADRDGYFISVCTDVYEGHAMFTLPVAVKVHAALGEAIRKSQEHRRLR